MTIINSFNPDGVQGPTSYSMGPGSQPQIPQINLSLSDLQQLLASIDLAVQRGAFRANELSLVGNNFDKVNNFINQVIEVNKPQSQQMPEPVAPMSPPFSPRGE